MVTRNSSLLLHHHHHCYHHHSPICRVIITTNPINTPNRVVPILNSPPFNDTYQANNQQIYQSLGQYNNNVFRLYHRVLSTYKIALTLFGIITGVYQLVSIIIIIIIIINIITIIISILRHFVYYFP